METHFTLIVGAGLTGLAPSSRSNERGGALATQIDIMETHFTLIVGAGLTGLSCAYHLGRDYLLVEKENEPGGMVRTRERHPGFLCDNTGHGLPLRNEYIKG